MKTLDKRQLQETLDYIDECIKHGGKPGSLSRLIIAADVVPELEVVVVLFADRSAKVYDYAWFLPNPTAKPDFTEVSVIDNGQTLRLGDYEVGTDVMRL